MAKAEQNLFLCTHAGLIIILVVWSVLQLSHLAGLTITCKGAAAAAAAAEEENKVRTGEAKQETEGSPEL